MVQSYEKKQKELRKELEKLLLKQKIRSAEQIEAYKLSVCHPHSAGIDLPEHEACRNRHPHLGM